ncbi:hypothetical protein CYLTODRAFT_486543 [Cylindrobasidium torrendii FP15055 ss-10]|uniref:CFEM domain-containing protein n=1 Tax=Cylindrobasidium torrendii FP15055 ss-10 TaxID=1314674 RepID=A0A0D7BNS7_9AGAR|nr:hypothetical protein CYLTODRAFT_486543 [Cylindrobasidium torrendii FP15055 ss-10]
MSYSPRPLSWTEGEYKSMMQAPATTEPMKVLAFLVPAFFALSIVAKKDYNDPFRNGSCPSFCIKKVKRTESDCKHTEKSVLPISKTSSLTEQYPYRHDFSCICHSRQLVQDATSCIDSQCNANDGHKARQRIAKECGPVGAGQTVIDNIGGALGGLLGGGRHDRDKETQAKLKRGPATNYPDEEEGDDLKIDALENLIMAGSHIEKRQGFATPHFNICAKRCFAFNDDICARHDNHCYCRNQTFRDKVERCLDKRRCNHAFRNGQAFDQLERLCVLSRLTGQYTSTTERSPMETATEDRKEVNMGARNELRRRDAVLFNHTIPIPWDGPSIGVGAKTVTPFGATMRVPVPTLSPNSSGDGSGEDDGNEDEADRAGTAHPTKWTFVSVLGTSIILLTGLRGL